jgi:4-hydroxybenzoate polyprenyltransferase
MSRLFSDAFLAMRPHQWVKNILVFAPLMLSYKFLNTELIIYAFLAFAAFSLTASGLYIINDLLDIEADKAHPIKRNRPFAAGRLSKNWGIGQSVVVLILAFGIASYLNTQFLATLFIYAILSAAYSFKLKKVVLLDVSILAVLYTLRIIAGTFATSLDLSYWLIVFSIFIFTSLAMVKRVSELYNLKIQGKEEVGGRGYTVQDHEIMSALGSSSGFVSVLVLALYIHDPITVQRYTHPEWLWIIVPSILYWIGRVWIIAHRGQMNEDPVIFAVHDKVSYLILLFIAVGVSLAIK